MPLIRVADAFDHPDWLFELKHDGFRALAQIDGHYCTLVSRRPSVWRPELFGVRRPGTPSKSGKPVLCAELQALPRVYNPATRGDT